MDSLGVYGKSETRGPHVSVPSAARALHGPRVYTSDPSSNLYILSKFNYHLYIPFQFSGNVFLLTNVTT